MVLHFAHRLPAAAGANPRILPFMIAVLAAKWVGDIFNHSIWAARLGSWDTADAWLATLHEDLGVFIRSDVPIDAGDELILPLVKWLVISACAILSSERELGLTTKLIPVECPTAGR